MLYLLELRASGSSCRIGDFLQDTAAQARRDHGGLWLRWWHFEWSQVILLRVNNPASQGNDEQRHKKRGPGIARNTTSRPLVARRTSPFRLLFDLQFW